MDSQKANASAKSKEVNAPAQTHRFTANASTINRILH